MRAPFCVASLSPPNAYTVCKILVRCICSIVAGSQGCGIALNFLWMRVDHYEVVEPHVYVCGRGSTATRSWYIYAGLYVAESVSMGVHFT